MKINFVEFAAKSEDERKSVLASLDAAALATNLSAAQADATALFALDAPTVAQADEAEAIVASLGFIEAEQAEREAVVTAAAKRFADAKAKFSVNDGVESSDDDADDEEDEVEDEETDEVEDDADDVDDETVEASDGENPFPKKKKDEEDEETMSAAAASVRSTRLPKTSAASKVGRKTTRPKVSASTEVVITAAADVQGFSTGQRLNDMSDVAKAVMARAKGFSPYNAASAARLHEQNAGQPMLSKFGAASFSVAFPDAVTASGGVEGEHDATKNAVKAHVDRITASLGLNGQAAMTAALAWCAPSEVVYNWIADYVVDGLKSVPQIGAPRGGLMLTEGPQLLQNEYGTDAAIDAFGFGGTEAEMEAGYVKTCETIVCPEFVDHRLDFDGYCWKIPILTQKTFPELVADAMRLSDVLYAHKMNRRLINDILAESTAIDATNAFGGTQVDTLESLTQVAIKERRWWNIGENAIMEVTLPQEALHIFKFDMARRSGLALNDIATEQKIAAHFANHRLAVEYVSDFDQRYGAATPVADWPETIRAIIYPAGTFVQAQEDVINLSAVYDAASLSANEYTGVFFEQGIKTIRRGYRSHVVEIPVCTAGRTGANDLTCSGFAVPAFDGSI